MIESETLHTSLLTHHVHREDWVGCVGNMKSFPALSSSYAIDLMLEYIIALCWSRQGSSASAYFRTLVMPNVDGDTSLDVLWRATARVQRLLMKAYKVEIEEGAFAALQLYEEATLLEDRFEKPSVKPSVLLPARDQYARALHLSSRHCDAVMEYERSLRQAIASRSAPFHDCHLLHSNHGESSRRSISHSLWLQPAD